jgi:hypothetical protein
VILGKPRMLLGALLLLLASIAAPAQEPVYCRPTVIEAMKTIWVATGNGTQRYEATFLLNGRPDDPHVWIEPMTREVMAQHIVILSTTFAVVHVHPNGSTMFPSTPQNAYEGTLGDTGLADKDRVDVYVISHDGLVVYYLRTKQTVILRRGLSWASEKGCL